RDLVWEGGRRQRAAVSRRVVRSRCAGQMRTGPVYVRQVLGTGKRSSVGDASSLPLVAVPRSKVDHKGEQRWKRHGENRDQDYRLAALVAREATQSLHSIRSFELSVRVQPGLKLIPKMRRSHG